MGTPLTRAEAKAAGRTRYDGGRPCPKGHASPRMTSTGACCECLRLHKRANQGKMNAAQRRHRKAYKEMWAAYKAKDYAENTEKRRKQAREGYRRNAEVIRKRSRDYHNRPEIKLARAEYRREYTRRPEFVAARSAALRKRRAEDPLFCLTNRMRCRLREAVRRRDASGRSDMSWRRMVGYGPADLLIHLERQFLPGMGWHNMALWHVDHIVPVVAFSMDDFAACWALSNLRPLWAKDNARKHAKREYLL